MTHSRRSLIFIFGNAALLFLQKDYSALCLPTERSIMLSLSNIRWCAEECERQQSGELSVSNMCDALFFARGTYNVVRLIDLLEIQILGQMIEPVKNKNGFRGVPVHFADMSKALDAPMIVSALKSLIEHGNSLSPTEWYKEFESIHPFIDGNGRVGAILFNVKNGTLKNPITPPDVFSAERIFARQ